MRWSPRPPRPPGAPSPLITEDEGGAGRYYRISGLTTGDYLRWLAGQGYTRSDIERVVTVERSAAEVYDDYVADTTKPTEDDQEHDWSQD